MLTLGLNEPREERTTDSVYGIARDIPLNYVSREDVDRKLVDNLTREKHLIIHGSSKQGKTCLRKHCLNDEDYIVVQCSNRWSLEEIHTNILKRAGYQVVLSEKKTLGGKHKVVASIGTDFGPLKLKAAGEDEASQESSTEVRDLELDASDVNDIIAALQAINFDRYIVLEDFHYLSVETQKDFAVALKAFHEGSKFCFLIIGVWLEENRLAVYNGDLTGRVVSINADKWTDDELIAVIRKGGTLLNISFDDGFTRDLLKESYGSVSIVQEACRRACVDENVTATRPEHRTIGSGRDVKELVRVVVSEQNARYNSFLTQFATGFQTTTLEMYKWLLFPIVTASSEKLEQGFTFRELRDGIRARHPSGDALNPGNLTQALQSTASLQVKKGITPIILDYDQTNLELNIVDRGFIIWHGHQSQADLLNECDLPWPEAAIPAASVVNQDQNQLVPLGTKVTEES